MQRPDKEPFRALTRPGKTPPRYPPVPDPYVLPPVLLPDNPSFGSAFERMTHTIVVRRKGLATVSERRPVQGMP